jgi:acetyltransferase-like isoleucine patch superfamily enzyme
MPPLRSASRWALDALADRLAYRLRDRIARIDAATAGEQHARLLAGVRALGHNVTAEPPLTLTGAGTVALGNNVHLGTGVRLYGEGGLVVGDHTRLGAGVAVYTTSPETEGEGLPHDHRQRYEPVTIGRNVYVGPGAAVLPGARIGDGAVVGAGTVVAGVVPVGAVVGAAPSPVVGRRDPDRYAWLEASGRHAGADGRPLGAGVRAAFHVPADQARPFFVVSTGRSGSMTVARVLSQHPDVTCLHEPHVQLIRLSTRWAEAATADRTALRAELDALYDLALSPTPVYGESDQNLSLLLDPLLDRYPEARVVWLVRDGRDVVASGVARGWYGPGVSENVRRAAWDAHRLQGDRLGDVPAAAWAAMTPFEKNCWYWAYVNRTVRERLAALPAERWTWVRLERLAERAEDVFRLIGVDPVPVEVGRHNRGRPSRPWTPEERAAFRRLCGDEMDRSYPGWRSGRPAVRALA